MQVWLKVAAGANLPAFDAAKSFGRAANAGQGSKARQ